MRRLVWLAGLGGVVLASLWLRSTFTKKDVTVSNHVIIDAVQQGDWNAITAVPPEPLLLSEDLERVMAQLNDEASQIATILAGRYPGAHTVRFMLAMAQSTHLQAAATAAGALRRVPQAPSAVDLAGVVERAANPNVRAQLYLALGDSHDADALSALRNVLTKEADVGAAQKGTAAAARLGGEAERAIFMTRVMNANVGNAKDVYDDLLYVGDTRFAKGLMPWLENRDPVTRLGSDADNRAARMCDVAVWTAMRLGVKVPAPDTGLEVYDDATLQATRALLLQLPEPQQGHQP